MRTVLLIAMREVQERRAVLAAALVAGLLPFTTPLLPGVPADRVGEARDAMAAILALGFGLIVALLLGATVVARDLAENRLGFDFARPIGGLAIWLGRFGAAVGLTLAVMAVVVAPAALVGASLSLGGETFWQPWTAVVGAVLLTVALAHVASVAFRSRSRWLALDLVGIVVVLLLAASGVRRIHDAFAVGTGSLLGLVAVVLTVPALWIASAVQVVRGRTDLVLGHRAQSVTLWSMLLVLALGVWGYGAWFVAAEVDDLVRAWARPAPQGSWILLGGTARGRPGLVAQFLFEVEARRSVSLGPGGYESGSMSLVSRDGRRAVWLHRESTTDRTLEVSVVDLDVPEPRLRRTSIAFNRQPIAGLSPSGTRLATLQGNSVAVHDLTDGRILAAATLDLVEPSWTGRVRVSFVDEDRVRIYSFVNRLVAYELAVAARGLTSWTGPAVGQDYPKLSWRSEHDRLILSALDGPGVLLLDGATGATLATLAPPEPELTPRCAFLADGRIARIAGRADGRATLELLDAEGKALAAFDLGPFAPDEVFWLGAEAAGGTLLIGRSAAREFNRFDAGRLMLINLESGAIRDVEGGGRPFASMSWIPQSLPAQPGSVAARLVQQRDSVWLLDVEAAALQHVAGRQR